MVNFYSVELLMRACRWGAESGIIDTRDYIQDPKTGKMNGSTPKKFHSLGMCKAEAKNLK